jgi:hypothetical protein
MAKKVELRGFMRIVNVFITKKWIAIDGYEEAMERFGHLLDSLNDEEAELLIELVQKYEWMSYNDYHSSLRNLLLALSDTLPTNINRLYVFPIVKPTDEEDIKSGHAVAYMIDGIKSSISAFDNVEIIKLKHFQDIDPEKLTLGENDFLVMVDDYIGTGNTLDKALKTLQSNNSMSGKFAVLSIAIQEQTKKDLEGLKVPVFGKLLLKRGISDENHTPLLEQKHEIMRIIENRIPKIGKYRNGYEKSEALITMIRTPNNTFPVFWKEMSHKGLTLKAPFQRN